MWGGISYSSSSSSSGDASGRFRFSINFSVVEKELVRVCSRGPFFDGGRGIGLRERLLSFCTPPSEIDWIVSKPTLSSEDMLPISGADLLDATRSVVSVSAEPAESCLAKTPPFSAPLSIAGAFSIDVGSAVVFSSVMADSPRSSPEDALIEL